jgi:hypothetical protein
VSRMPPYIADCDDHDAELADLFNIHAALVAAEKGRPALRQSARWQMLRMDAYEAFWRAMQGEKA